MDINKTLKHYNDLTKGIYSKKTYEIHLYFSSEFKKACDALSFNDFKRMDIEKGYIVINYFKNHSKKSNDTINKIISYIKRVMLHEEIFTSFVKLPTLKIQTHHFQRFYHEELKSVVEYIMNRDVNSNSLCYRTAVLLLLDSGLRLSELLSIKKRNIDFYSDPKRIYIEETKNKKSRYVPFSEFSASSIKELMDKHPHDSLFWNFKFDSPFTRYCMRSFYRIMQDKLNIERIHSHRFRKTFASLLAENGMSLYDLQLLLDHTRISTTQLYIQTRQDRGLKSYSQYKDWKLN